ncbi:hypothetical protein BdWA1_002603 [Babesia duncani]|uniref:6-Cys domain-containing protein n=1 Tax=Babesia duncani TaxID=323732 RepID=A0AAD9PJU6_9APIC|nr:hypothetical protein BdWA1_002603 [Babesia duncani]
MIHARFLIIFLIYTTLHNFAHCSLTVDIDKQSDYEGIKVECTTTNKGSSICKHSSITDDYITLVVGNGTVCKSGIATLEKFVIVYKVGLHGYFKIHNSTWDFSNPYTGFKYKYYLFKNGMFNLIGNITFIIDIMVLVKEWCSLELLRDTSCVHKTNIENGQLFHVENHVKVWRVRYNGHPLFKIDKLSEIDIYKVVRIKYFYYTIYTIFCKDNNDNDIRLDYILQKNKPLYIPNSTRLQAVDGNGQMTFLEAPQSPPHDPISLSINTNKDTMASASDYEGIKVECTTTSKGSSICKHSSITDDFITLVVGNGTVYKSAIATLEKFVIVYKVGLHGYFKIHNPTWDFSNPYTGFKYNYFIISDGVFNLIGNVKFKKDIVTLIKDGCSFELTKDNDCISKEDIKNGHLFKVKDHAAVFRVRYDNNHMLTTLDKINHVEFYKAIRIKYFCYTIYTLFYKDINDNKVSSDYILQNKKIPLIPIMKKLNIVDWKGQKTFISEPESSSDDPVMITINLEEHVETTSICKVIDETQSVVPRRIYLAHQVAIFKGIVSCGILLQFKEPKPFLILYYKNNGDALIQTLSYDDNVTILKEYKYFNKNWITSIIIDLSKLVYLFPLYIDRNVDDRLYFKRQRRFGGEDVVFYTARKHVAFSRIYRETDALLIQEIMQPIYQFIIQGDTFHIVIKPLEGFERWYKELGSTSWIKAPDDRPQYSSVDTLI